MTEQAFRRLALSLPGTEERAHMSHPDFRVGGKIFATMGSPGAGWAMVKLPPADQARFAASRPEVFVPLKGAWGQQGCTNVVLEAASLAEVRAALRFAYEACAPAPKPARVVSARPQRR